MRGRSFQYLCSVTTAENAESVENKDKTKQNILSNGDCLTGSADMLALEAVLGIIAEHIPSEALVLIETTVAPGTTEQVAYPIMKKIFEKRGIESDPLLVHSYERVMPGKNYVASIRDFWRVCDLCG